MTATLTKIASMTASRTETRETSSSESKTPTPTPSLLAWFPMNVNASTNYTEPYLTGTFTNVTLGYYFFGDDGWGPILGVYPPENDVNASYVVSQNISFFDLTLDCCGCTLEVNYMQIYVGRGGDTGVRGWIVYQSTDNYTTQIGGQEMPSPAVDPALFTVPLSGIFDAQTDGGSGKESYTVRIFSYTPSMDYYSMDYRDISIWGHFQQYCLQVRLVWKRTKPLLLTKPYHASWASRSRRPLHRSLSFETFHLYKTSLETTT